MGTGEGPSRKLGIVIPAEMEGRLVKGKEAWERESGVRVNLGDWVRSLLEREVRAMETGEGLKAMVRVGEGER